MNISVLFFTELFFFKCLNKYPSHCFQNTFWIERRNCHLVQNRKKCNPQCTCMSSFFKKIKNSELKITLWWGFHNNFHVHFPKAFFFIYKTFNYFWSLEILPGFYKWYISDFIIEPTHPYTIYFSQKKKERKEIKTFSFCIVGP